MQALHGGDHYKELKYQKYRYSSSAVLVLHVPAFYTPAVLLAKMYWRYTVVCLLLYVKEFAEAQVYLKLHCRTDLPQ